jgi:hypothetical protein
VLAPPSPSAVRAGGGSQLAAASSLSGAVVAPTHRWPQVPSVSLYTAAAGSLVAHVASAGCVPDGLLVALAVFACHLCAVCVLWVAPAVVIPDRLSGACRLHAARSAPAFGVADHADGVVAGSSTISKLARAVLAVAVSTRLFLRGVLADSVLLAPTLYDPCRFCSRPCSGACWLHTAVAVSVAERADW